MNYTCKKSYQIQNNMKINYWFMFYREISC